MGKFTFGQSGGPSYECDKVDIKVHEGAPRCPRCNDRVYFNEEKKALGKSWHSRCFTCCQCNKTLSSTNYNELDGELVCTPCHKRYSSATLRRSSAAAAAFTDDVGQRNGETAADDDSEAAGGITTHQAAATLTANRTDLDRCPRCGERVFFAEEIKALKRKWHRLCFKCVACARTLDPGRCSEHDGQLYCHQCHVKQFGPHVLRPSVATATDANGQMSFASDARLRVGNGALLYTDTLTRDEITDEDHHHHHHLQQQQVFQPIRGAQEWTESFEIDLTSRDRFRK